MIHDAHYDVQFIKNSLSSIYDRYTDLDSAQSWPKGHQGNTHLNATKIIPLTLTK